jgi:Kae1-associated kinase Bud32
VRLFRKGAEADLYCGEGRLVKERVGKAYRIPELDIRLRRQRTRREARNLGWAAECGVKVPKVAAFDEKACTIEMELVEGELAKDAFERGENVAALSQEIGRVLRRLHDGGLVHNDLTTSNLIVSAGGVCVIDFGLSYRTTRLEDKAMDLVVFKKSILATHTGKAGEIWEGLIAGYKPDKETSKRVETIEKRVRYRGGG